VHGIGNYLSIREMFFPEGMSQYALIFAPLVSLTLVVIAALVSNAIIFPSILGNAVVKVLVHTLIYFEAKIAYLMYRVWPTYLKQATTPSVGDFVERRAGDTLPAIVVSATVLFIVALVANVSADRRSSSNVWVTAIVFAVAYAATVYGALTDPGVAIVINAIF
jgi:heme/copper-type cytochrome/quinol oxidase subunit 4